MKVEGTLRNLETLKIEVSMVDTDKEGHLRGGFTALAAPSGMTSVNDGCNIQCNFDCNNGCNGTCVNKEDCAGNANSKCNEGCNIGCNVSCTNPTDPTDPTSAGSTGFMNTSGFSLLF